MSQPLPHASQTSLGETCAFYLDYITASLPSSLHSLHHKFLAPLIPFTTGPASSSLTPLLRFLPSPPHWVSAYYDPNKEPAAVAAVFTLVACAIALVVMSWRNFWRRPSPSYHPTSTNPNERPSYTYLTPDDIVEPPVHSYDGGAHTQRAEDDSEPDKLLLNHRRVTYELHFPPYSINDGTLSVGQLRQSAAEVTHTANPARIKLLYKGKLLDDDSLPCRSEGLKQQSEILCVVSEVQSSSDPSDTERTSEEPRRPHSHSIPEIVPKSDSAKKNKRKKNKKGKKKKTTAAPESDDDDESSPAPQQPHRPTPSAAPGASGSRYALPPPAPSLSTFPTPIEQVRGLSTYLREVLVPLCNRYITETPSDKKERDFEHKKLGETILAQVILNADSIEVINEETRNARRALIKEAQAALNSVDAVQRD
ncbi:hypothetical protein BDV18DRAFT_129460 [Aspergillus unguis]